MSSSRFSRTLSPQFAAWWPRQNQRRSHFSIARLFTATLLATYASLAPAQSSTPAKRIAFLSPQSREVMNQRGAEVLKALRAQRPAGDVNVAEPEMENFSYKLPNTERPSDEAHARKIVEDNQKVEVANRAEIDRLLAWRPDVIYAPGALPALYAASATKSIPIVFGCKCNPLKGGWNLIEDPSRPERNLTGFTRYDLRLLQTEGRDAQIANLFDIRLSILKASSLKTLRRVALINGEGYSEERWHYREKSRALGLEPVDIQLTQSTIGDLGKLIAENKIDAGLIFPDTFFDRYAARIIAATAALPIPTIFPWDEANQGAWLHYGTKVDIEQQAAEYIAQLLGGKTPAELPVLFPSEYELGVNYATAARHGWAFPKEFLLRPHKRFGADK